MPLTPEEIARAMTQASEDHDLASSHLTEAENAAQGDVAASEALVSIAANLHAAVGLLIAVVGEDWAERT